jgi:hypothetical protein
MKLPSYLKVELATILTIILYPMTSRRYDTESPARVPLHRRLPQPGCVKVRPPGRRPSCGGLRIERAKGEPAVLG